jgi:signal transduction histidine kinase
VKIRARLTLTYLVRTGATILLLGLYDSLSFERFVLASARGDVAARAHAVGESISDWIERGDRGRVPLVVERYAAQEEVNLQFFAADGTLEASSDGEDKARLGTRVDVPGVATALAGEPARGRVNDPHRAASLYEARPLARNGRLLGVLRVTTTLAKFEAQLRSTRIALVAALVATFLGGALVASRLARGLARPIQRMRDFAVKLGQGELSKRLDIVRGDELGELAEQLNRMGARLEAVDLERRSFLANASHELRTPVSNVLVTLEALREGAGDDPVLRARFLETALTETRRMSSLVQELLDLGRLEARVVQLEVERITVAQLCERAVRAIEPRTGAAQVSVRVRADDSLLAVDVSQMMRALLNLLDNALKVSPKGGTIVVEGGERAGRASIVVGDEGPGIEADDLPRIFEQFYTADRSRKRGGIGLGLAIARRIVETHGGTLQAANRVDGPGARFVIDLPLG